MGYYVTADLQLSLKKGIKDEEVLEKIKTSTNKDLEWWDGSICIENRNIYLNDGYIKFHEENWDALLDFLAPLVEEGRVGMSGEDSSLWAYELDGNGSWKQVDGVVLYDYDAYRYFMEEYKDKMPDKLKQQVEAWKMSLTL